MSIEPGRVTSALPLYLAAAALMMLPLAGLAFWPQYLSKIGAAGLYTHLHASLGLAWLLVLIGQPLLFRARRLSIHRVVGRGAAAIGAAFVVVGVLVAHQGVSRMDDALFAREGYFVYMPLILTVLFAAALVLGLIWRSVPAVHGRFMACTALAFADPLLARILSFYFPPLPAEFLYQVPALVISCTVLLAMLGTLPHAVPGRNAFRAFAASAVVALLLFFLTPYSTSWFAFASWFRALPIT